MLTLTDHCPVCFGSLQDAGTGEKWICRVCRTEIETDGDGTITRMVTPEEDDAPDYAALPDAMPDEDEATAMLGELFRQDAVG